MQSTETIKATIREEYGETARRAARGEGGTVGCCGGSCGAGPLGSSLYEDGDRRALPAEALAASLGCGTPTARAELRPGDVVLDLGSGGGIDVLLSARRVGPTGQVYGLDMTDDMLALARDNQRKAGLTNVEFLKGDIEAIPLPDASVDVVISNCVINLAPDKDKALGEAFRVLRPGGRFAVSDIVALGRLPDAVREDAGSWVGCVAGALEEADYRRRLTRAGFRQITIETSRAPVPGEKGVTSAFIRAVRPERPTSLTEREL